MEALGPDLDVRVAIFLDDFNRDFTADRSDFALEISNAGFFGVVTDHSENRVVGEDNVFRRQAIGFPLLAEQVLLRNAELFELGVAGNAG